MNCAAATRLRHASFRSPKPPKDTPATTKEDLDEIGKVWAATEGEDAIRAAALFSAAPPPSYVCFRQNKRETPYEDPPGSSLRTGSLVLDFLQQLSLESTMPLETICSQKVHVSVKLAVG